MTTQSLDPNTAQDSREPAGAFASLVPWTPLLLLFLVLGVGYYAISTRSALEARIAELESANTQQVTTVTNDVSAIKSRAATLMSNLETLDNRVVTTTEEVNSAKTIAENLKHAQDRLAKTVAANATGLTEIRDETTTQLSAVNAKVGSVSTELKGVATGLDSTRADLAAGRRALAETSTRLSGEIAKNAGSLAELQRKGEHDVFEFDIQKSGGNDVARIEDVRIQLTKADARHARYNVALLMDDRRVEKKDLFANEPFQFVVGKDKVRYEVVVTHVERDRVRGYVTLPKDRPQMTAQSAF